MSPWGNSVGERAHRHVRRRTQSALYMGNSGWYLDSLNTRPNSGWGTHQKYLSQVADLRAHARQRPLSIRAPRRLFFFPLQDLHIGRMYQ